MGRDFDSTNSTSPNLLRLYYRGKWDTQAFPENNGLGKKMIKDLNFLERVHYGMIDNKNNSVIPNENFIVSTTSGRVFDFVADSYSLMKLNLETAGQRGLVSTAGSAFGNIEMVKSYKNPRLRYGEYLGNILRLYNDTHIPDVLGKYIIQSYEDYVNYFFDFLEKNTSDIAITMTRWNTTFHSSILDTGLSFQFSDIGYDEDQQKIDTIVDHPCFGYVSNLCLNMGFSIPHQTPQILLYDLTSPAGNSIRNSYGLYNLEQVFLKRFIKTFTIDLDLLFNNINIYFNKYAQNNSIVKVPKVVCGRTDADIYRLYQVSNNVRPFTDIQELELYCRIRNLEEGSPFSRQKISNIFKKSKFLLKTLDKLSAMSYINDEFRDQVWNKDHGYDDRLKTFTNNS